MKKITTLLLVLMMLALTACSGSNSDNGNSSNTGNNNNSNNESNNNEQESSTEAEIISKEGDVLVDNEYCKVTYMGLNEENSNLVGKFNIENKTDTNFQFSFEYGSVDGLMSNFNQTTSVDANSSKEYPGIFCDDYVMGLAGITKDDITKVDFKMVIWTSKPMTYYHDDFHTLYLTGSNSVKTYQYTPADTDVVVLDNEYCKITYRSYDKEDGKPLDLNVYIENKTDTELRLNWHKSYVDGAYKSITTSYTTLAAGTSMYESLTWYSLEEYSMDDIGTIEIMVKAYSDENYATAVIDETISITP